MQIGRNAFKILTEKSIGKRSLGTAKGRSGENIKINIEEMVVDMSISTDSAQDRDHRKLL